MGSRREKRGYSKLQRYALLHVFDIILLQIIIAGDKEGEDAKAILGVVNTFYLPNKILIVHQPGSETFLSPHLEVLGSIKMEDDKATAYVCENYTCSAPVNDPDKLKRLLNPVRSQI